MKTLIVVAASAALMLLSSYLNSNAETPTAGLNPKVSASDEQTINSIEHRWCEAFLKGDADYIDSVMDPTFVQTNVRGEISDKPQELTELRHGDIDYDRFETSDLKVHLYDNCAVVTGQTYIKGKVKATGRQIDASIRITDTFVKRNGAWKIVASHTTMVPAKSQ
jgi:ketosteroid isomerase-like protein